MESLVYHFAECLFESEELSGFLIQGSVRGSFSNRDVGRYHFLVFLFRSLWHKRVTFSFSGRNVNDPEFAKNVKGLEGMLRVRERLGESSRVCVPAQTLLCTVEDGMLVLLLQVLPVFVFPFSGGAARVFS